MERDIAPIGVIADFGHANGIEMFWDMRMNDTHDAMIGGYGPYLRPQFKLDNPEYLVGSEEKTPPHGPWTSVNFAEPAVRDLAYRFFEEVCTKFDVDGIELDFFRHACFFKSVAWGDKASQEELDMMTDLIRQTRAMTEREGMRRGRPILVAIRIPDSVDYCRDIGLDVETWLDEGLVDILSGTCYFQLNPWEYLVDLGHRYGVPVYPSLSESRVSGETRFRRGSIESYRARAAQVWQAGADGVYMFNYFNPRGDVWRELGDRDALRSMDKLYFVAPRNGSPTSYLADGARHQNVPILTPSNPWLVPSGAPAEIPLPIGDDLTWAVGEGLQPKVTCHVRTIGSGDVEVAINGHSLSEPVEVEGWLDYDVPPAAVKTGDNVVALRADPPADAGEWSLTYDGSSLPEMPWQEMGFYGGCVTEVVDGALLIADRGTEGGNYAFYQYPCFIQPEDESIIEFRAKVISDWSSVMVENGTAGEEIQLYPDRVKGRHTSAVYMMDTTDDFHTYRMVLQGDDYRVYVDGELRLDGEGLFTRPAHNGRSGVMFGAANSGSLGEALWQSVKVRSHAATLIDLALSIDYQEG